MDWLLCKHWNHVTLSTDTVSSTCKTSNILYFLIHYFLLLKNIFEEFPFIVVLQQIFCATLSQLEEKLLYWQLFSIC